MQKMRYRLALDLGSTSLGWAMLRLNAQNEPCAIIKAGVRIFSDGREAAAPGKLGTSLAAKRREKRSMRRRRDRLLRRKKQMLDALTKHGFFPGDESSSDIAQRKSLERINPYELRAKGLHELLSPTQLGRALFHLNQRRGFKSNRKTDKRDDDNSAQDKAISKLEADIQAAQCKTVGEYLWRRMSSGKPGENTVRARNNGMVGSKRAYDLYINRAMIAGEFDALWSAQKSFWERAYPSQTSPFTDMAKTELRDKILLYQRNLKPVQPGRCTLLPEEPRAPLALPSVQRFRIYQEVNNLKYFASGDLEGKSLSKDQRDRLVSALEKSEKEKKSPHTVTFAAIKTMFGWDSAVKINLAGDKRDGLKGNTTGIELSKKANFGVSWHDFSDAQQDEIVKQLLSEEDEAALVRWLKYFSGISDAQALSIAKTSLVPGYASLCTKAITSLLPILQENVVKYHEAAEQAGFGSHSALEWNYDDSEVEYWLNSSTGEVLLSRPDVGERNSFAPVFKCLPYYGKPLKRHVAFADPKAKPTDSDEKYFGKIANPTVHIGLNQIRKVVNDLIRRYGRPTQIVVEVARELKQNEEQRAKTIQNQAANQIRNAAYRKQISEILNINEHDVTKAQIHRLILWNELSGSPLERFCPYSGKPISPLTLLRQDSPIEIEHILPFAQTLDDSLNNKTVAFRLANQLKGKRSPWEARESFNSQGGEWLYDKIAARAAEMPPGKSYRFSETAMQQWLRDPKNDFLARNLNDTKYLSRIAREYMSLLCPEESTWVVPGILTGLIRHDLGLDEILSDKGKKNRNDHRHHAVDACVIGVMSRSSLKKFADANTSGNNNRRRLVEAFEPPWRSFRDDVSRAVDSIKVSHKPDHGFEDAIFKDTAYGIGKDGAVIQKKITEEEKKERKVTYVVALSEPSQSARHGVDAQGKARAYKGYVPDGNYCLEVIRAESGDWQMDVVPTFRAYEIARSLGWGKEDPAKVAKLVYEKKLSTKPGQLVMKLTQNDIIRAKYKGKVRLLQVVKMSVEGGATFTEPHEASPSDRYEKRRKARLKIKAGVPPEQLSPEENDALNDEFLLSQIGISDLFAGEARRVTISPIGELHDPGFKG